MREQKYPLESHQVRWHGSAGLKLRLTLKQPSCCCTVESTCSYPTFQILAAVSALLLGQSDYRLVWFGLNAQEKRFFFKVDRYAPVGSQTASCFCFRCLHPVTQQDACVGVHLLYTRSLMDKVDESRSENSSSIRSPLCFSVVLHFAYLRTSATTTKKGFSCFYSDEAVASELFLWLS